MGWAVQDGFSCPERWGPWGAPTLGHSWSSPGWTRSRVRPVWCPGLLDLGASGGALPCREGTQVRPQPRRQHFCLGGQSLSCRHRRRHPADQSPSAIGGQSPGCAGTCGETGVRGLPLGRAPLRGELLTRSCAMRTAAGSLHIHCPREGAGPGRGAQPGTGQGGDMGGLRATGRWWCYPRWVVCRCVHSRWCSTWQPQGSRCRCHRAPGRVPGTLAAPRGMCRASPQHGDSLLTTGTTAVPGSCFLQPCMPLVPIVPSSHPLVLSPVPRLTVAGAVPGCVCGTRCHSWQHALPGPGRLPLAAHPAGHTLGFAGRGCATTGAAAVDTGWLRGSHGQCQGHTLG